MEKSITRFLNEENKEYSLYVLERRAIPSIIDGLKTTQRKVLDAAKDLWRSGKNENIKKVYQLAGVVADKRNYHHSNCLDYDTEIYLADGTYMKIGEWAEKFPGVPMFVYCMGDDGEKTIAIAHSACVGAETNIEYEIEVGENIIKCTANHPFYTQRGWIIAEELTEEDEIINY
jgi:hypothetical protein